MRQILGFVGLIIIAGLVWYAGYPDPDDPKNIGYVLWKVGPNPFENLDDASNALVADVHRDNLVIGKTEEQLRMRFGFLLSADKASPKLRRCLPTVEWASGKHVMFIRNSYDLIVFDKGVATGVGFLKEC